MRFSLILVLLFAFSSGAEYKRGSLSCSYDFEEKYDSNSERLEDQYVYAFCKVVKGEDTVGLAMLYDLADRKSLVTSSFFLAQYLATDGEFKSSLTRDQLDESIKYYLKTLAIIDLISNYPEPDYWAFEKFNQMELESFYSVPYLYLAKHHLGAVGDYHVHLFQSPSYQGDRSKNTYPKYNTVMRDSLNKLLYYAETCASLPQKGHFNPSFYKKVIKACGMLKDLALTLIPLETKRQEILLQPHCEDLNEANCPEYYETHLEIQRLRKNYIQEANIIFTGSSS